MLNDCRRRDDLLRRTARQLRDRVSRHHLPLLEVLNRASS
jgi:hypothetical protein